ncbi:hypothetical protein QQG55_24215 [Brugia pahangi]
MKMQASRSDSGSIITLLTLYLLSWVGCEDVQGQLPTPLSPCSPSVSLFQAQVTPPHPSKPFPFLFIPIFRRMPYLLSLFMFVSNWRIFLSSLPLIKSPIRLFPGPMSSGSRSRSPTNIFPFTNSVIRPH